MLRALATAIAVLIVPAFPPPAGGPTPARADTERYTAYCADERIEISFWDVEQMKVRRGSDVCVLASYTSYSSALDFVAKNFGDEGVACGC